jgi:hypothetical protein
MDSALGRKMNDLTTSLERLEAIGFRRVGVWMIQDERITLTLDECGNSKNILYSFVIDQEPVYIGKTVQKLKQRLYGYANPGPTQSTNIRGNKNISESIANGKTVEIFALPDHGLLYFGGFHLNLAAALEDSLVLSLRPIWNMTGMRKA